MVRELEFNPLISVVIPVYNSEKYILKCIDTVINQDYKNLELILINDGSYDNSLEKIKNHHVLFNWAQSHSLIIKTIRNSGVSNARNIGIQLSTGSYIAFVDSDDFLEHNHFSELIQNINKNTLPIVSFRRLDVNLNLSKEIKVLPGNYTSKEIIRDILDKKTRNSELLPAVWNKLFSLDIIKSNNIKFEKEFNYGEDWLFVLNYLRYIDYVKVSNAVTYIYRQHNGARLSSNYRPNGFEQAIKIRQIIASWFPEYSGMKYFTSIVKIHSIYQSSYARQSGVKEFGKKIKALYDHQQMIDLPEEFSKTTSIRALKERKWKIYYFYSLLANKNPLAKHYISKLIGK